jgi:hypothetical protein
VVLFLAAGVLFWLAWQPQGGNIEQTSSRKDLSQIEGIVNRHLIMTNKKIELEQEQARLKVLRDAPTVGEQILPRWRPNQNAGVDHSPDRNELNAARDLERRAEINLSSPDTVIQSELADSEALAKAEAKYREEYARKFIENARAGGYEIQLDENYVVKSVKKIEPNQNPRLFQGRASASH